MAAPMGTNQPILTDVRGENKRKIVFSIPWGSLRAREKRGKINNVENTKKQ